MELVTMRRAASLVKNVNCQVGGTITLTGPELIFIIIEL